MVRDLSEGINHLLQVDGARLAPGARENATAQPDALTAMSLAYRLVHDDHGVAYAVVDDGGGQLTMEVRSLEYLQHLRRRYYRELRRVPSEQALAGAVAVTEAEALEQGESVKLGLRFYQERDDLVWIDLGDATGRAVRITPVGWDLVSVPPVLFRRFPHMSALPEPVSGGSLADLFQFVNLKREEDRITLLPWLVTLPLADIPRQLLLLHGTQGSGKSVAARMLRSLLDPCRPDLLGLANGELETAQILDHNALPIFDNLTMDYVTSVGRWEGTASELLTVLTKRARPEGRRGWPLKPDWLSRRIAALVPLLREVGIMVEYYRGTGGRRIIRIPSGRN